jgi:hypothetical protein
MVLQVLWEEVHQVHHQELQVLRVQLEQQVHKVQPVEAV